MKTISAFPVHETHRETVHIGKRKDFGRRICEMEELTARRAHEIFERKGRTHGHDLEDWFEAQAELFASLPGKVVEAEFSLEWLAEIGDFRAKDLEVHVEPRRIVVLGRRVKEHPDAQPQPAIPLSGEKEIFKVVELPLEVDPVMVTANIRNGVLEVFLLKARGHHEAAERAAA